MSSNLAKHTDTAKATEFTRGESDNAFEAKAGRTDAVNAGIVKKADAVAEAELKGARKGGVSVRNVLGRAVRQAGGQEGRCRRSGCTQCHAADGRRPAEEPQHALGDICFRCSRDGRG